MRAARSGGTQLTGRHVVAIGLALLLVVAVGVGLMVKLRGGEATATADTGQSSSVISGPMNSAKDVAVEANVRMIHMGVESYIAQNGEAPDPAQVSAEGAVGQLAGQWPTNPYTDRPTASGMGPGEYTYTIVAGGAGYSLVGYGFDGPVCTMP